MGSCFGTSSSQDTSGQSGQSSVNYDQDERARNIIRESQLSDQYTNQHDYKFQYSKELQPDMRDEEFDQGQFNRMDRNQF